jgi:hypothetical protein
MTRHGACMGVVSLRCVRAYARGRGFGPSDSPPIPLPPAAPREIAAESWGKTRRFIAKTRRSARCAASRRAGNQNQPVIKPGGPGPITGKLLRGYSTVLMIAPGVVSGRGATRGAAQGRWRWEWAVARLVVLGHGRTRTALVRFVLDSFGFLSLQMSHSFGFVLTFSNLRSLT